MKLMIKVTPRAKKQRLALDNEGLLHIYVTAPADENRANEAVIEVLAKALRVPKRAILILQGATSRKKVIEIDGFQTVEQLFTALKLR